MLIRLLILFTVVPLAELYLLMYLADVTSSPTLVFAMVILSGVLGASLARWQGVGTWRRLQRDLAAGRLPADALLDGVLILVAGALLLTPGILTDLAGVGLLVPPLRNVCKRFLIRRFKSRFHVMTRGASAPDSRARGWQREEIIEGRMIDPRDD